MRAPIIPPKPRNRPPNVMLWKHLKLFKEDVFMAQPKRLYRAWMAEMNLVLFKSYFVNDPDLLKTVLNKRPADFPKSELISASLGSLLGTGVFISNGELWKSQRRIIDPAFEGGRLRSSFTSIKDCANDAVDRLMPLAVSGPIEVEEQASMIAGDIIFRTLFSIPITNEIANETYHQFRTYQRTQPLLNFGALLGLRRLIPFVQRRKTRASAQAIRAHLRKLTHDRADQIAAGTAPDDLATNIMTNPDPETGKTFSETEMVDQVAIFFLAGHETSASALAWALYLLAIDQNSQDRVFKEASKAGDDLQFADLSKLEFTRNVFREVLRLYPPVPMMVRESTKPENFRDRKIKTGSQIVLSPWHLHRHERLWDRPDEFDPDRWKTDETRACARDAYMPFSSGPRVCPGAGFAMIEGVLLLYTIVKNFKLEISGDTPPVPVSHLTVRAKDGIFLKLIPRT